MHAYDGTMESTQTKPQRTINADRITTQKNPDGTTTMWNRGLMDIIPSGEPYTDTKVKLYAFGDMGLSKKAATEANVHPLGDSYETVIDGRS